MAKYRAIVSITFDDEDLEELKDQLDVISHLDPIETIRGELDNLSFGSAWIEQVFKNESPMIHILTEGIKVTVSPHD